MKDWAISSLFYSSERLEGKVTTFTCIGKYWKRATLNHMYKLIVGQKNKVQWTQLFIFSMLLPSDSV